MSRWWTAEVEGVQPAGRGGHASCAVDDMVIVFGGTDRNVTMYDEVWVLEAGTGKLGWTLVHAKQPPGVKVTARVGATLTAVGNSVYLVGGQDPTTGVCFNEVLVLDTLVWEWSRLEIRGVPPPARHSHCTGQFQHSCLLMFGGANPDGLLSDVWILNVEQGMWVQPAVTGVQPEAREMHVGVMLNSTTMLVYGGRADQGRVLNDVLLFDGMGMSWVNSGTTAFPRCSHSGVLMTLPVATPSSLPDGDQGSPSRSSRDMLVVFGGFSGGEVAEDVLLVDPHTLVVQPASASSTSSKSSCSQPPLARFAHCAVTLKDVLGVQGQVMLVFGGVTPSEDLKDVAIWIPDANGAITEAQQAGAGARAAATSAEPASTEAGTSAAGTTAAGAPAAAGSSSIPMATAELELPDLTADAGDLTTAEVLPPPQESDMVEHEGNMLHTGELLDPAVLMHAAARADLAAMVPGAGSTDPAGVRQAAPVVLDPAVLLQQPLGVPLGVPAAEMGLAAAGALQVPLGVEMEVGTTAPAAPGVL